MLSKSQVKYIQSLGHKKFRDEGNCFVAEGSKIVGELITSPLMELSHLYALNEWLDQHQALVAAIGPDRITKISARELESVSFLTTPNQVMGVFKKPVFKSPAIHGVVLLLDNIQDPGNLGSLVRIADWFGISAVVCDLQTADVFNPKVVQATMGSISRVPVIYTALELFIRLHAETGLYATVLNGEDLRKQSKIDQGMVLIGNESRGVNNTLMEAGKNVKRITIPGRGAAESLNAAVAAGIVLSHLLR